jgi:hypothetical protein
MHRSNKRHGIGCSSLSIYRRSPRGYVARTPQ